MCHEAQIRHQKTGDAGHQSRPCRCEKIDRNPARWSELVLAEIEGAHSSLEDWTRPALPDKGPTEGAYFKRERCEGSSNARGAQHHDSGITTDGAASDS